ncbi:hypothetical protein [Burkholderia ambifaria]|uniref:hypothetical protein n=1 Tax=Burkholderia ambifaria TaxID=152480 RepID=UPI00315CAA43
MLQGVATALAELAPAPLYLVFVLLLANSPPAILAGYITPWLGLLKVAHLYGDALILLVLTGLVFTIVRHWSDRRVAGTAAH